MLSSNVFIRPRTMTVIGKGGLFATYDILEM